MTLNELEKNYQPQRISTAQGLKIFPESRPYLQYKVEKMAKEADILKEKIISKYKWVLTDIAPKNQWFWNMYIALFERDWEKMKKEVKKMNWILNPPTMKEGQITEAMIERAREFPIEDLFEGVSKNHFVKCPFHDETKPSAYLKNNYFYCFGCNIHKDTIGILMARDKLTFPEAVKRLN